ncbi:MAG TPA: porin family protein [Longimicrobiales bacterium]
MKRWSVAFVSALLGVGMPVSAQAQGISFGATVGLNRATIASEELEEGSDLSARYGLLIGGFMEVATGNRFAIRPELLFVQKGVEFEEGDDTGALKFSYIEVPVLARFALDVRGASAVTPVLFAGPAIGFRVDAELESTDDDTGDVSDIYKSTDFGLVLGGGLEVSSLSFDLRYEIGLMKLDDAEDIAELSNRGLSLTVGYTLPFGM